MTPESKPGSPAPGKADREWPPRVFLSSSFKDFEIGAQYTFAYKRQKFPEDVEYLSVAEHQAILAQAVAAARAEVWEEKEKLLAAKDAEIERLRGALENTRFLAREIVNASYTEFRGYGPNDDGTIYSDRCGTEYWKGVEKAAKYCQQRASAILEALTAERGGKV